MKFGILGEAKIAREHVVPAILNAGHEVTHVEEETLGKWLFLMSMAML